MDSKEQRKLLLNEDKHKKMSEKNRKESTTKSNVEKKDETEYLKSSYINEQRNPQTGKHEYNYFFP